MKAIVLTRGRIATVDDEDFDRLNAFKWFACRIDGRYYAARSVHRPGKSPARVYMHRDVLQLEDPKVEADHKNGNGLDNWRDNLRMATSSQNKANRKKKVGYTSRYKGVSAAGEEINKLNPWVARIVCQDKLTFLGYFSTEEGAARAYDRAAHERFGEFAVLNFPV